MTPRLTAVFLITVLAGTALEGAAFAAPSAEELFNQGKTSFAAGDYASAVARWTESYSLSQEPELLFNIAQALRHDGRCVDALAKYQRFVAVAPRSEQRPLADEFIVELRAKCDVVKAPREAPPSETLVEHPPSDRLSDEKHSVGVKKIAGLAVASAGLVSFATGLGFGWRASSLGDEVTRDCSAPSPPCEWSVEKVKQSDGQRDATVGRVLDVVGVAAIAAGIGLYIYGARDGDQALMIQPHSTGATMSWSGRW